jgi:PAS domain S-box-containing protein
VGSGLRATRRIGWIGGGVHFVAVVGAIEVAVEADAGARAGRRAGVRDFGAATDDQRADLDWIRKDFSMSEIRDPSVVSSAGALPRYDRLEMDTNESPDALVDARSIELGARLAAIVDSSDDAIVNKTLDGVITSWNRGAERLFGYTAAEAVGHHISLIVPEDRRAEEEDVLARLRRGERVDHFETIRRAKDGHLVSVSLTVSPVRDARGVVIGASKVARDITQQQQSEELRARLAAIVDSSDDAIVSKTLEGVVTSWNRGAERLFGYTAAEAIGQHISLIIPDDRKAEEDEVLGRLRRGERIDHFETVRQAKDGRKVYISLTVSPLRDAKGTVIGASKVARNITERMHAEEALRRAHAELEERVRERTAELSSANEAIRVEMAERQRVEQERIQLLTRLVLAQEDERRRIARDLHDQLGQQLTALRLTLETLKAQSVERSDLRVQVETLEALARQLDEDVAFRVGELRPTELENLGLQAALTNHVRHWSKHFGIRAQLHTGQPTDERLTPDTETMLYRLAQEALNNVAKHARADHVDVVLERSAEHVSLIIEDNGVGFDASKAGTAGEGLGLIGMRERAALVGADFQIESTPGRGTTVIVRAPAAAPAMKSA